MKPAYLLWLVGFSFSSVGHPSYSQELYGYVANARSKEGYYGIFEFDPQGRVRMPVSKLATEHVAWPSGILIGDTVHVYASVSKTGVWSEVRRWTSEKREEYVDDGPVFTSDEQSRFGIGPSTITYQGGIFRLFYLVRGEHGPGFSIRLAISHDGLSFTDVDTVFVSGTESPGGVSLSYACTDGGEHHLFLHRYARDLQTADSFVATSRSATGPYTFNTATVTRSGSSGKITGEKGSYLAHIAGSLDATDPIIVVAGEALPYRLLKIDGAVAHLDRPLSQRYAESLYGDLLMNKADLSFAAKTEDGTWRGVATGYGQFQSTPSEFTVTTESASLGGPWATSGGISLAPPFGDATVSTENPEPIRRSSSCRLARAPQ